MNARRLAELSVVLVAVALLAAGWGSEPAAPEPAPREVVSGLTEVIRVPVTASLSGRAPAGHIVLEPDLDPAIVLAEGRPQAVRRVAFARAALELSQAAHPVVTLVAIDSRGREIEGVTLFPPRARVRVNLMALESGPQRADGPLFPSSPTRSAR